VSLIQPNPTNSSDLTALRHAIAAACEVAGRTSPNPPVGAVVVRDGVVVGSGATQPPGGPHAEVVALRHAGAAAHGAELFVTLEPCTFHGRTPPCTDAIIAAGIRRVSFVARDSDPRIGAGAAAVLGAAGIAVQRLDDCDGSVAALLAPFRCRVATGRPLVTHKYAMTLDGRIATATGSSRWISGTAARRRVHELRDHVDAIIVGVGTVLGDDPELTTRLDSHWRPVRHPLRVILDSRCRTPPAARVLDPALPGHTLIATAAAPSERVAAMQALGATIVTLPGDGSGRVDVAALLQHLGRMGANHVLLEGGAEVAGAFHAAGLIDEIHAYVAPKTIAGADARGPLGGSGVALMADAEQYDMQHVERIGRDVLIVARAANACWWHKEGCDVHRDR